MTRNEMYEAVRRFRADRDKPISNRLLCEAAGISIDTFKNIFDLGLPMSEMAQRRLGRALTAWANGDLRVMRNRNASKYIEYRREAKPDMQRGVNLTLKGGRIVLKVGPRNMNDYTQPSLKERLEK